MTFGQKIRFYIYRGYYSRGISDGGECPGFWTHCPESWLWPSAKNRWNSTKIKGASQKSKQTLHWKLKSLHKKCWNLKALCKKWALILWLVRVTAAFWRLFNISNTLFINWNFTFDQKPLNFNENQGRLAKIKANSALKIKKSA